MIDTATADFRQATGWGAAANTVRRKVEELDVSGAQQKGPVQRLTQLNRLHLNQRSL